MGVDFSVTSLTERHKVPPRVHPAILKLDNVVPNLSPPVNAEETLVVKVYVVEVELVAVEGLAPLGERKKRLVGDYNLGILLKYL